MTYQEMLDYCKAHRESDGFCRCSSAWSGLYVGGTQAYYDYMSDNPNILVYRGGNHGSRRFEVKRDG